MDAPRVAPAEEIAEAAGEADPAPGAAAEPGAGGFRTEIAMNPRMARMHRSNTSEVPKPGSSKMPQDG
jgi:hypothetical protein